MNIPVIPPAWVTLAGGLFGGGLLAEFLKTRRTPVQRDVQRNLEAAQRLASEKATNDREAALRENHLEFIRAQIQSQGADRDDGRAAMQVALEVLQKNVESCQTQIIAHQGQLNQQNIQLESQRVQIRGLQDEIQMLHEKRNDLITQLQSLEFSRDIEIQRGNAADKRTAETLTRLEDLRQELGTKTALIEKHENTIIFLRAKLEAIAPNSTFIPGTPL